MGDPLAEVAMILPVCLADRLASLCKEERSCVEEIRLRRGHPMSVVLLGEEHSLGGTWIGEGELRGVLERATQASAHTVLDQVKRGFVALKGGHRIGLCGTVSCQDGTMSAFRYLSSMSIRIARAVDGQAERILPMLIEEGVFQSTLILGPPGCGKTTLLRDLIRTLSEVCALRVGIADERGEIAAMWKGEPQFCIGRHTDVLDGCSKAEGLSVLLRGMNPQVLAADEITHPDDVAAILEATGCGAAVVATAHGGSISDLSRRPVYRAMMAEGVFRRVIVLTRHCSQRSVTVEVI